MIVYPWVGKICMFKYIRNESIPCNRWLGRIKEPNTTILYISCNNLITFFKNWAIIFQYENKIQASIFNFCTLNWTIFSISCLFSSFFKRETVIILSSRLKHCENGPSTKINNEAMWNKSKNFIVCVKWCLKYMDSFRNHISQYVAISSKRGGHKSMYAIVFPFLETMYLCYLIMRY